METFKVSGTNSLSNTKEKKGFNDISGVFEHENGVKEYIRNN